VAACSRLPQAGRRIGAAGRTSAVPILLGTTLHRRAFKITAGPIPRSPKTSGSRYRAVSRASRWQPFVLIDTSPALTSTQELRSESLLKNKSLGRSATMSTRSRDRRSQKNAQKIELYSLAYRTAWRRISPGQKRGQPDLPLWLHTFIRHEIKEGATEASVIASEALKALGESEPGTPQSQES
jgi:hypothetical protein